jgi:ATP-dependent RNA helicase RhlE
MPFTNLGLSASHLPALQRALLRENLSQPTEIQRLAIPAIVQGRDVLATAQTGSGKTLTFVLPILDKLASGSAAVAAGKPQALIVVPTRELALQVGETFKRMAQFLPSKIKTVVLLGGQDIAAQIEQLKAGTALVVATPGRLLDVIDQGALSLKALQTWVLDEADRLLDLGFEQELARIVALLPEKRQTLLLSATFPPEIEALAQRLMTDPVRVKVVSEQTAPDIAERAFAVDVGRRAQLLRHLFVSEKWKRVLVFAATKHACNVLAMKLRVAGFSAEPMHGDLTQGKREQVLQDFKASRVKIVVATDLAARGIDIKELPVVVNYDLPRSPQDYTHRIGRTGRAGESGQAVSFITATNHAHWALISKRHGLSLPMEQLAGFEPSETQAEQPAPAPLDPNGGIKGRRPSKKDKLRAAAAAASATPAVR